MAKKYEIARIQRGALTADEEQMSYALTVDTDPQIQRSLEVLSGMIGDETGDSSSESSSEASSETADSQQTAEDDASETSEEG